MNGVQAQHSPLQPSPVILDNFASSSSSRRSLEQERDDDSMADTPRNARRGSKQSIDDLRLLAISAQITEVSYSIGELQTRIFEIQELRHRSIDPSSSTSNGISGSPSSSTNGRKSSDSTNSSTAVIDNALGQLDVRLDSVRQVISTITNALEPLLASVKTPTQYDTPDSEESSMILRKYGDLMMEWDSVQADATGLRDELGEDKFLTVFRTVSEQADGMMQSLDKAINVCQDFINQVYSRTRESSRGSRPSSAISDDGQSFPTLASYNELMKSFEGKKKYYISSTSKVLGVIQKGIEERRTKNGECLRKYADMRTRWDALKIKIKRVDREMEKIHKVLLEVESSEAESVISETSMNLNVSPAGRSSRAPSNASTSTLARFAARVSNAVGRSTPSTPNLKQTPPRLELPGQHTPTLGRRTSFLPFRTPQTDSFMVRPKLFSSTSSMTAPPSVADDWVDLGNGKSTVKPLKPRWNASTRPLDIKDPPPLPPVPGSFRPPSATGHRPSPSRPPSRYGPNSKPPTTQPPPIPARSTARPFTPVRMASHSSSTFDNSPPSRPGSRAQSSFGINSTPRARPKTPSMIPTPRFNFSSAASQFSDDLDYITTFSQRTGAVTPSSFISPPMPFGTISHKRRPSASAIPIPAFHQSKSRATSPSGSPYRPLSPPSSAAPSTSSQRRSKTPELSPTSQRTRPTHHSSASTSLLTPPIARTLRASSRGPPSSFRGDGQQQSTPPSLRSRPSSRAGSQPPGEGMPQGPLYLPLSARDPLDTEVARVVNSVQHGMQIERLDPPLKGPPSPGEEIKAQYAVFNTVGRRVMGFKLLVINRQGLETRKVMCRVGGGWVDLATYMTNRYSI